MISQAQQDRTFELLQAAALRGERCPQSYPFGPLRSNITSALAKAGRIRIEIFKYNWRVVTLMEGPHKGKQTAPSPEGGQPYRTIFKDFVSVSPRNRAFG